MENNVKLIDTCLLWQFLLQVDISDVVKFYKAVEKSTVIPKWEYCKKEGEYEYWYINQWTMPTGNTVCDFSIQRGVGNYCLFICNDFYKGYKTLDDAQNAVIKEKLINQSLTADQLCASKRKVRCCSKSNPKTINEVVESLTNKALNETVK
ncbi:MAG: hypothetical protein WCT77_01655 [Bacteroidota bacterium]